MDDSRRPTKTVGTTAIEAHDIDPSTPLFKIRPFLLLFITRVSSNSANQMLGVSVGYQVYELTGSAFHLGLIGAVQFLPPLFLMLLSGQIGDTFNRRLILRCCFAVEFSMLTGLMVLSLFPHPNLAAIYVLLLGNATARTFEQPVMQSLVTVMAPRAVLGRAVAAHVSAGRLSLLLGPSIGGVLYLLGATFVYIICTMLILSAATASFMMPNPPIPEKRPEVNWHTLVGGFRFILHSRTVLGAMTMDLIATMLGGVQALLPIYARDILQIGPWGAGILRSSPAVGALATAAILSRFPVQRNGGVFIFTGFALYGLGTIVFGLSHYVVLSIAALLVLGVGDILSSVVRQTVIQVSVPDDMRSRVFAVNSFFTGCSGQLGSFRAGMMAAMIGAVGSVAVGGCCVFVTMALWAWLFPTLRRLDNPDAQNTF